jgi:hydrogenase maturation protein HypF
MAGVMTVNHGPVVRLRVRVQGTVQGVGFRPFVYTVATELELDGFVGNDGHGVVAEVEGTAGAVSTFVEIVRTRPPTLAVVDRVDTEEMRPTGDAGFRIIPSVVAGTRQALVTPDAATCADCLRELWDPANRRYRYPFTNCTNCGPRYTIVCDVPYDRGNTTMAHFVMCDACRTEYEDTSNRRFHAEPVCCPACGPQLRLLDRDRRPVDGDPIEVAARLLSGGAIVAVKGIGGYHLAVDATDDRAVVTLRGRKHRYDRPFAVMVPGLGAAHALCRLQPGDEAQLTSATAPIVLLVRRDGGVAAAVAPLQRSLGLMLPYTPMHHLLLAALMRPMVLTSGNVSDEPIAFDDDDAFARLGGIADAFLTHDRRIRTRVDDTVVRSTAAGPLPVRRSRGHVPQPVRSPERFPRHVLATGPELKSTFCLARDEHAFVSHHIGDLENYETFRSFVDGIDHLQRLLDVRPEVVAHDLHPDYLSTRYALEQRGDLEAMGVQHHHAHIASCLADNGVTGPVIGVAFDGLGYGDDATLWGGEFLVADLLGYRRVGHLEPVPLPGGATAIRQPWRMAAVYLDAAYGGAPPSRLDVVARNRDNWDAVVGSAKAGLNAPLTSSAGRLFDAIAALVGVRDEIRYEGQAAVELEVLADDSENRGYRAVVDATGEALVVRASDLVRDAAADLLAGASPATVSARFHNGLADVTVAVCRRIRDEHGPGVVALSGGVFQNVRLLDRCGSLFAESGFTVLTHHRVPPNDGGVSLGQAAIAGARDRLARDYPAAG